MALLHKSVLYNVVQRGFYTPVRYFECQSNGLLLLTPTIDLDFYCLLFGPAIFALPSFLDGFLQQLLQGSLLLVVQRYQLVHLGAVCFLHYILILWREIQDVCVYDSHKTTCKA